MLSESSCHLFSNTLRQGRAGWVSYNWKQNAGAVSVSWWHITQMQRCFVPAQNKWQDIFRAEVGMRVTVSNICFATISYLGFHRNTFWKIEAHLFDLKEEICQCLNVFCRKLSLEECDFPSLVSISLLILKHPLNQHIFTFIRCFCTFKIWSLK